MPPSRWSLPRILAGATAAVLLWSLAVAAGLAWAAPVAAAPGRQPAFHSRAADAPDAAQAAATAPQALAIPPSYGVAAARAALSFHAPPVIRNTLMTPDGTLDTSVGYYTDCTGQSALTHEGAAIDTCIGGRWYFIGHNPGVFSVLAGVPVGQLIYYYDGAGRLHTLKVVAERVWMRSAGVPPLATPNVVAQFQTCLTLDGSIDRILDAVPA